MGQGSGSIHSPALLNMVDKILKIILVLSPIIWGINTPLNKIDSIFFILSCASLFLASLVDYPKRNINIAIPAISLFALCVFNLFQNNFHSVVLSATINIFFGIVAVLIISNYVSGPKKFYPYIIIPALINIIIFAIQKMGYIAILNTTSAIDPGGILGNAPRLATYFCLILAVAFNVSWILFSLFILVAIVASEHTLLIAALVLLFLKAKNIKVKIGLCGLSILGIVILIKPIITSILVRVHPWKVIFEEIVRRPLLGYGMGLKTDFFNEYLNIWWSLGIMGLVWLGYVIYKYRKIKNLLIVPFLIICFTEYPLAIPRIWITLVALIAFSLIQHNQEEIKC